MCVCVRVSKRVYVCMSVCACVFGLTFPALVTPLTPTSGDRDDGRIFCFVRITMCVCVCVGQSVVPGSRDERGAGDHVRLRTVRE